MNIEEEYFLGALGDAYVDFKRNELQVYQKNEQWLEMINQILQTQFGVSGKIFRRKVFLLRKRSKPLVEKIKQLQKEAFTDGRGFVAGLFDAEGSIYFATRSKSPVIDITQSSKGLQKLLDAKAILERLEIRCSINGPYNNHGKLLQYHLRVYTWKWCKMFLKEIKIRHPDKLLKLGKMMELSGIKL